MSLPERRYFSTTLSDLVLALSAFGCVVTLYRQVLYAAAGFVVVGAAASFGVLRFGVVLPWKHSTVIRWHTFMSWFATIVGIPLIAAGFCMRHYQPYYANMTVVGSTAGFLISLIHPPLQGTLSQACSTLAVLGIVLITYLNMNYYGMAGGIAYAVSGAVKGVESLPGLRGVDVFHYALVAGNILFMYGLVN